MVPEDAVEPVVEERRDLTYLLGVPAEALQPEPVEQGAEAPGPLGGAEVDGTHTGRGEVGGPTLGARGDSVQAGGVNESDSGVEAPPLDEDPPVGMGQPELSAAVGCCDQ